MARHLLDCTSQSVCPHTNATPSHTVSHSITAHQHKTCIKILTLDGTLLALTVSVLTLHIAILTPLTGALGHHHAVLWDA